jgi:tetratricopeptide (TPR) repeat protein
MRALAPLLLAAVAAAGDAPGQSVRISVSAWENTSVIADAPWLADAGADLLATQLAAQPGIVVLERDELASLVEDRAVSGGSTSMSARAPDPAGVAPAAAHRSDGPRGATAEYVVGGSYRVHDGQLEMDVRVVRANGQEVLWSGQREAPLEDYAATTQLLGRLCARWFVEASHLAGAPGQAQARSAPLAVAASFYRAQALMRDGMPERAVADLIRVAQRAPGYGAAWRQLGITLDACGRTVAADAAFAEAMRCDPDDPDAARALYETAMRLRDRDAEAARRLLQRVVDEHPFSNVMSTMPASTGTPEKSYATGRTYRAAAKKVLASLPPAPATAARPSPISVPDPASSSIAPLSVPASPAAPGQAPAPSTSSPTAASASRRGWGFALLGAAGVVAAAGSFFWLRLRRRP